MEACANDVKSFAAGGVLFQVHCCTQPQIPNNSVLTGDLDRLYCHCIAAPGLDWRYNIAPISIALFIHSRDTVYSEAFKNLSTEPADQAR